jgi:hypothetical protein
MVDHQGSDRWKGLEILCSLTLHQGTACPRWASTSNTLDMPSKMLKTGSQSPRGLSMAKGVARGEDAALERRHRSPNNRTPAIDCCDAQQGRAVTTAIG